MPTISVSKEEYNYLLKSHYRIDPSTGDAIDSCKTKGTNKYKATLDLHQLGSRLNDGCELLDYCSKTLKDESATKKIRKEAHKMIDNSSRPLLAIAVDDSHQAANIVSPIGRSEYTHRREEFWQKKQWQNRIQTRRSSLHWLTTL